jgi:hypothetical protein
VKRAESEKVFPSLFERDIFGNQINDIRPSFYLFYFIRRNMSFHCPLPLSFQDKNIDADKSPKGAEVSGLLTRSSEWQIIGREHFQ